MKPSRSVFILCCLICSFNAAVFAQNRPLESLVVQYNNSNAVLREKLFVHLDRPGYFVGETMWFKIYCVDAAGRPLNLSKVAYVELLDRDSKAIVQAKIALAEEGFGYGSIVLPISIASGNYVFRAYTNWMQNFGADRFFQTQVTIINPFSGGVEFSGPVRANDHTIQFFPEGGNLVYGLRSKVAFRAVDIDGQGLFFEGAVVNQHGDTVTVTHPLRPGIGHFYLRPQKGEAYRMHFQAKSGATSVIDLPEASESGFTMHMRDRDDGHLHVDVAFSGPNQPGEIYLVNHKNGQDPVATSAALLNNVATFELDKRSIPEGVSHLTIFDQQLQPVCDRLYFRVPEKRLNIVGKTDQFRYATRKRIKLNLKIHDSKQNPTSAHLSVAIYRMDSLYSREHENISAYMDLMSDLGGSVEDPAYYDNLGFDSVRKVAIDNLMLTHRWREPTPPDSLEHAERAYRFLPEIGGHLVAGTLNNKDSKLPARDIPVYISLPGPNPKFLISRTDSSGRFIFNLGLTPGDQTVIMYAHENSAALAPVFHTPYSGAKALIPSKLKLDRHMEQEITSRSIHMQVQRVFQNEPDLNTNVSISGHAPFFGKPDRSYLLDDFVRFPTMEEVLRENIPEIVVRKRNDEFTLSVQNSVFDSKVFLNGEPLILFDGVPVFETNRLMELDPRQVKRVDVVTRKYFYGGVSFEGILSMSSYNGDLPGFGDEIKKMMINYGNVMQRRKFFAPTHQFGRDSVSFLPDARTLLLWEPALRSNAEGVATLEVFSSDIEGRYRVVVNGINSQGLNGSAVLYFEIKSDTP